MKKRSDKQRLFEVMSRLDKTFKINENKPIDTWKRGDTITIEYDKYKISGFGNEHNPNNNIVDIYDDNAQMRIVAKKQPNGDFEIISQEEQDEFNLDENIIHSKYGHETINYPIIPDAINVISKNPKAIKFNNRDEFKKTLKNQEYFSASHSHCYYSVDDMEASQRNEPDWMDGNTNISEANKGSILLFETGKEIVAVWDERNNVGYIVPSKTQKNDSESIDLSENTDHKENLEYFLSFNDEDIYWKWVNGEIDDSGAIEVIRDANGVLYDPNINYIKKYS